MCYFLPTFFFTKHQIPKMKKRIQLIILAFFAFTSGTLAHAKYQMAAASLPVARTKIIHAGKASWYSKKDPGIRRHTANNEIFDDLPMVFNLSGYQSVSLLKTAEEYADIYLPDFKYADRDLARKLSRCQDYPDVALAALSEMLSQKGFLDSLDPRQPLATKGVMVRHLILPGYVENSINALTTLFVEFGARLPLSLMSQYVPVTPQEAESLNRHLTEEEFNQVYSHAMELGFRHLFVQFPAIDAPDRKPPFLPDFRLDKPFSSSPDQD